MRYIELDNQNEIISFIAKMKREYRDLSKIFVPSKMETTAKGKKVLVVYQNLDAVMKIEADEKTLHEFLSELEQEKKAYAKR